MPDDALADRAPAAEGSLLRRGSGAAAPTVEDATRRLVADWHTDRARIPELTMIALGPSACSASIAASASRRVALVRPVR